MALPYVSALFVIVSLLSSVKADLVNDICSKAQKPAICLSALNGDSRSKGANLEGLAAVSIDLSLTNMQSARNLVNTLLNQATNSTLKKQYGACLGGYAEGIDELTGLPAFLKSKDYAGLNIHASLVYDDASACDEIFSDPRAEPPQLKNASEKLKGLIDVILVISNLLKGH